MIADLRRVFSEVNTTPHTSQWSSRCGRNPGSHPIVNIYKMIICYGLSSSLNRFVLDSACRNSSPDRCAGRPEIPYPACCISVIPVNHQKKRTRRIVLRCKRRSHKVKDLDGAPNKISVGSARVSDSARQTARD